MLHFALRHSLSYKKFIFAQLHLSYNCHSPSEHQISPLVQLISPPAATGYMACFIFFLSSIAIFWTWVPLPSEKINDDINLRVIFRSNYIRRDHYPPRHFQITSSHGSLSHHFSILAITEIKQSQSVNSHGCFLLGAIPSHHTTKCCKITHQTKFSALFHSFKTPQTFHILNLFWAWNSQ